MQYLGICQQGKRVDYNPKLHAGVLLKFLPEEDGLTFHLNACFTDSLRQEMTDEHAAGKIRLERICGPVEQVDDTTFTVRFTGWGCTIRAARRTSGCWPVIRATSTTRSRAAGESAHPLPADGRETPAHSFPGLEDVKAGSAPLPLKAVSDCGLPVYYYVKEGPARITKNDMLEFTPIPPRSRFPIKMTVVAWQYGLNGKVQTAEPVERSFYIYK